MLLRTTARVFPKPIEELPKPLVSSFGRKIHPPWLPFCPCQSPTKATISPVGQETFLPWFVPEMKGVFQRILQATLLKDGVSVKQVGRGFVLFIAFHKDDTVKDLEMISNKVINARLWDEGTNSWNKSVKDLGYEVIVVYQPDLLRNIFDHSSSELMPDEKAADLYGKFVQQLKDGLKKQ